MRKLSSLLLLFTVILLSSNIRVHLGSFYGPLRNSIALLMFEDGSSEIVRTDEEGNFTCGCSGRVLRAVRVGSVTAFVNQPLEDVGRIFVHAPKLLWRSDETVSNEMVLDRRGRLYALSSDESEILIFDRRGLLKRLKTPIERPRILGVASGAVYLVDWEKIVAVTEDGKITAHFNASIFHVSSYDYAAVDWDGTIYAYVNHRQLIDKYSHELIAIKPDGSRWVIEEGEGSISELFLVSNGVLIYKNLLNPHYLSYRRTLLKIRNASSLLTFTLSWEYDVARMFHLYKRGIVTNAGLCTMCFLIIEGNSREEISLDVPVDYPAEEIIFSDDGYAYIRTRDNLLVVSPDLKSRKGYVISYDAGEGEMIAASGGGIYLGRGFFKAGLQGGRFVWKLDEGLTIRLVSEDGILYATDKSGRVYAYEVENLLARIPCPMSGRCTPYGRGRFLLEYSRFPRIAEGKLMGIKSVSLSHEDMTVKLEKGALGNRIAKMELGNFTATFKTDESGKFEILLPELPATAEKIYLVKEWEAEENEFWRERDRGITNVLIDSPSENVIDLSQRIESGWYFHYVPLQTLADEISRPEGVEYAKSRIGAKIEALTSFDDVLWSVSLLDSLSTRVFSGRRRLCFGAGRYVYLISKDGRGVLHARLDEKVEQVVCSEAGIFARSKYAVYRLSSDMELVWETFLDTETTFGPVVIGKDIYVGGLDSVIVMSKDGKIKKVLEIPERTEKSSAELEGLFEPKRLPRRVNGIVASKDRIFVQVEDSVYFISGERLQFLMKGDGLDLVAAAEDGTLITKVGILTPGEVPENAKIGGSWPLIDGELPLPWREASGLVVFEDGHPVSGGRVVLFTDGGKVEVETDENGRWSAKIPGEATRVFEVCFEGVCRFVSHGIEKVIVPKGGPKLVKEVKISKGRIIRYVGITKDNRVFLRTCKENSSDSPNGSSCENYIVDASGRIGKVRWIAVGDKKRRPVDEWRNPIYFKRSPSLKKPLIMWERSSCEEYKDSCPQRTPWSMKKSTISEEILTSVDDGDAHLTFTEIFYIGRCYVTKHDKNGKVLWRVNAGFGDFSGILKTSSKLYVATNEGRVLSFDEDGKREWMINLKDYLRDLIFIDDGLMVVGREKVYGVSTGGILRWRADGKFIGFLRDGIMVTYDEKSVFIFSGVHEKLEGVLKPPRYSNTGRLDWFSIFEHDTARDFRVKLLKKGVRYIGKLGDGILVRGKDGVKLIDFDGNEVWKVSIHPYETLVNEGAAYLITSVYDSPLSGLIVVSESGKILRRLLLKGDARLDRKGSCVGISSSGSEIFLKGGRILKSTEEVAKECAEAKESEYRWIEDSKTLVAMKDGELLWQFPVDHAEGKYLNEYYVEMRGWESQFVYEGQVFLSSLIENNGLVYLIVKFGKCWEGSHGADSRGRYIYHMFVLDRDGRVVAERDIGSCIIDAAAYEDGILILTSSGILKLEGGNVIWRVPVHGRRLLVKDGKIIVVDEGSKYPAVIYLVEVLKGN